jgi:YggT family protein
MTNNDLITLVDYIFTIATFLVIGRALLSWFDPGLRSSIGRLLVQVTEPIIGPIRRVVPSVGMFDLSPIIAIFVLQILRQLIVQLLAS